MTNKLKFLLLTVLLSTSFSVSAQNISDDNSNADSTSINAGGYGLISSTPPNPNSAVIAPQYCPNQNVSWVVGSNTCTGTANTANTGVSRNVIATGINSGSATYTCNSSNTFTGPTGASCTSPPVSSQGFAIYSTGYVRYIGPTGANGGGAVYLINNSNVPFTITHIQIRAHTLAFDNQDPSWNAIVYNETTNMSAGFPLISSGGFPVRQNQDDFNELNIPITVNRGNVYRLFKGGCGGCVETTIFGTTTPFVSGTIRLSTGQEVNF
ncbi:MAG: hypothetical protein BVN34_06350 [Proteobacteria bacterium ST_bin12]|nr:MAG: hypothetical protein BVN34_06350 [Proteobacteria bacterium ST_bin12]